MLPAGDEHLRLILDNVQDVVFRLRLHPELTVEYVSPSCEALTGYRPEEWYDDPALPLRVVVPEDRPVVEAALGGGPGSRDATRWRHRDGTVVWVETERRILRDEEGRAIILEGVGRDITARVAAEREAKRARALFESVFDQAPVGMGLTSLDPGGADRLVEVNDALCTILGRTREELLSRPLDEFTHPEDRGRSVELKRQLIAGEIAHFVVEKRYMRGDGSIVWGALQGSLLRDADGHPVHGLGHVVDITERVAYQDGLRHRALHDALTELPNRQLFLDRLEHALTQRPEHGDVGVLFADIDDLKAINDEHGHAAGDAVIRELGRRFAEAVRPGDSVARFAGDEFTVLCPGVPGSSALGDVARRLLDALSEPVMAGDRAVLVGASLGAAVAPPGSRSADELLADADVALLEAKRAGKGRVHIFDERTCASARARRTLEAELHTAVEERQFVLHYQPIVGLVDQRVNAIEALVRWEHPGHGLLPPGAFIGAAERLGLIDQIGRWVVTQACRDGAGLEEGRRVSINISPRELRSTRLLDDVAAALDATGFAGTALCFEITESAIIEDPPAALTTLRGLKELGAVIALDDFGTGFSSLGQLAGFPVDVVKLDRAFVADLTRGDRRRAALVRAVLSMAEALDMDLVAEGIETPEQHEMLLELGCTIGQGFLFGVPVPFDALQAQWRAAGDA